MSFQCLPVFLFCVMDTLWPVPLFFDIIRNCKRLLLYFNRYNMFVWSRLSTAFSLHTCPPLRLPSVTSCWVGAPTLWHPSPRPPTWSSSTSSWPWPPGTCRDAPTPWRATSGTLMRKSKGRRGSCERGYRVCCLK